MEEIDQVIEELTGMLIVRLMQHDGDMAGKIKETLRLFKKYMDKQPPKQP